LKPNKMGASLLLLMY